MRPLRHTVPLGAGETPASFVSRLAALHRSSAREICLDMGTTFQKVVDGDPKALAIVAFKASVEVSALAENAFVRGERHQHSFRGEELTRDDLFRATVVVCPKCLSDDISVAPRSRPETVAVQRARWQIAALKTCPNHLVPLVVVDKDMTPKLLHDWSYHVGKILPQLTRLAAEAVTRPLTGFEAYVLDRINAGPIGGRLIDGLPLFVAIAACELFGAVATLGRMPNLKTLTDEEWRLAGAAGFDTVALGKPGIEMFLEHLQAGYAYSGAATEGPQALFGRIYQVLEFGRKDSAFDPLRDLVGTFILKNFPLGPGDVVFGKPVAERRLHSIRTLSKETGLHPKRLRKVLEASGVLPDGSDGLADGNCLFDAERGSAAAREAAVATLSVRKAGVYLNAPRVQRNILYWAGLIVPRVGGAGAADQFAPEDLDAFLARLLDGALLVDAAGPGQINFPDGAKQACCSSAEIVRLVLDGKLTRKWRLAGERGYMSVLVDIEEVRPLVRGPDHGGFTGLELKDKLSSTTKVVAALIKYGHLKTVIAINPINRCPVTIVRAEEAERFAAEYISLFALAKQQGRHFMVVKKKLDAAGIKPALDPKKIGASFYRRDEIITGKFTRNCPTGRKEKA